LSLVSPNRIVAGALALGAISRKVRGVKVPMVSSPNTAAAL
jgi:hypothetical protein